MITFNIPSFKGLGTIYRFFNNWFVKMGVDPIMECRMKDRTRLFLDSRANTEIQAFYEGEYDKRLISTLKRLLMPDTTFVDIGSNIGFYTIAIANEIKLKKYNGKVISFEPFFMNFQRIKRNVSLNNLEDIVFLVMKGLSNTKGITKLVLREDFVAGSETGNASIYINQEFDQGLKTVEIETDTLDSVLTKDSLISNNLSLFKIDIEGHEDFFLEGSTETLNKNRPIILIEVNKIYYKTRGINIDARFSPLIPQNYILFKLENKIWKSFNSFDECEELDNALLIPEEKITNHLLDKINYCG